MGKLLVFLSFISLVFLQIGSYLFPGDPVMWLAGNSQAYEVARLALLPVLAALLVTNPPRHLVMRYFVGLLAVTLLGSVAYLTYSNTIGMLDTLAFAAAGISMGIVTLEINYGVSDTIDLENLRQSKHSGPLIQQ